MFSLRQEALLYSLRPASDVRLIPPMDDRRVWKSFDPDALTALVAKAERVLRTPLPHLTAGDYLKRPSAAAPTGYTLRREHAMALVMGACASGDEKYLSKAADLIWMMAEESSWATFPRREMPLPNFGAPDIDLSAARTAELFALTKSLVGAQFDRMTPQLNTRIEYELKQRIFTPLIQQDGVDLVHVAGEAPRIAAHLTAACLSAETDEDQRRWQVLRRVLKILENYLSLQPADGGATGTLSRHIRDVCALNDCFRMLALASGGEVELRDEAQFVDMAVLPCKLYIAEGWFLNPGGDARPRISPDALFSLGEGARSMCLCALAAYLRGKNYEREPMGEGIYAQFTHLRARGALLNAHPRQPIPGSVLLPDMGVAAVRSADFFAALSGGGERGAYAHKDAGDFTLFFRDDPVLIDCGLPDGNLHNVPAIEDIEQSGARHPTEPPELTYDGYFLMSMNIAHAYPSSAHLYSWQRSVMLTAGESAIRLIDTYDFDGALQNVSIRFITPYKPEIAEGGMRLGPVWMRHPAALRIAVDKIPMEEKRLSAVWGGEVFRIAMTTDHPAPGGRLDFIFTPVET